jgi:hypothetical protein
MKQRTFCFNRSLTVCSLVASSSSFFLALASSSCKSCTRPSSSRAVRWLSSSCALLSCSSATRHVTTLLSAFVWTWQRKGRTSLYILEPFQTRSKRRFFRHKQRDGLLLILYKCPEAFELGCVCFWWGRNSGRWGGKRRGRRRGGYGRWGG